MSESWTVARVMEWSGDYLKKAGIPEPAHEVQIMMSEILGTSRMGVYLNHTKILEKKELERFRGFLLKRKEGYPLQYILGKAYFYGREFVVREGCFIPQFCTELLADKAIGEIQSRDGEVRVLEVGGGSGALGITVAAEADNARVHIMEKHDIPFSLIEENIRKHGMEVKVTVEQSDFFSFQDFNKYHMIISNPPYIAPSDPHVSEEVKGNVPHTALYGGNDGLDFYKRFNEIKGTLDKGVLFLLEIGYNQAEHVKNIFHAHEVTLFKDLEGHFRAVKIV